MVRSGEHHFTVFCTEASLESQHEEVMDWVRRLTRRLQWTNYEMSITRATEQQANERLHALFEHRYPAP